MCHFLLLENEQIAGYLVLTLIQSLEYPVLVESSIVCIGIGDCGLGRRVHRTTWVSFILNSCQGYHYRSQVDGRIVGTECDMINIIRDIYGRLVLGQYFLPGGQGPGLQQPRDPSNSNRFEQTKVVDKPFWAEESYQAQATFHVVF